ncbi:protein phosphatase PHLPP-like protein isoform X2 [Condylostylus longicornis]|uniref:protein phosphatase PHLPP-like protein isoform X2 n=1 Tax=Condylostylus longicornis TaxID=2530218 RepID=UPI00244E45AB|nr:protein phosphatase PHLPP-like protein isoform X2 [Condylostylus longicornis]
MVSVNHTNGWNYSHQLNSNHNSNNNSNKNNNNHSKNDCKRNMNNRSRNYNKSSLNNSGKSSIVGHKTKVTFSFSDTFDADSLEEDSSDENYEWNTSNYKNVCNSRSDYNKNATSETNDSKRLDIGNSGLRTIPEVVLQSIEDVEELLAGQNKLQEIGLQALAQFSQLQILRLPGNGFSSFPLSLLSITSLTVLDLADNSIDKLPDEISQLINLQELRIDRNVVTELPNNLRYLRNLKSLQASQNQLRRLPQFMIRMKTMGLVDMYAPKPPCNKLTDSNSSKQNLNNQQQQQNQQQKFHQDNRTQSSPPLTKVSLRANHLRGNIILGNYGNLTQLDVSENEIEILDLCALGQLESLQCCRNKLTELIVNGSHLTSLIAGNNELKKLSIVPVPSKLRHLDVSFNSLVELPQWLNGCNQLRTLFANNNQLRVLPDHLFCSELNTLHTLQLSYNNLQTIPAMPRRKLQLQELFLQCNELLELSDNFFFACENLVLLNVSSNKLSSFPITDNTAAQLERLYATKNDLTDRIWDTLVCFKNLRIFHAAYNKLTTLPDECVRNWAELEELVLSGNNLQHLPDFLSYLTHLKVLRVHSNRLQTTPALSKTSTLRVLDLAHNQLDKINLVALVPKKLQFLDLSCNVQLQVDPKQLQVCRSQRPMSLIDVSGKNRSSLPTSPDSLNENMDYEPPWKVGFSEAAGNSSKLYISQLRLPNFCNIEGLFGMFDGEVNNTVPSLLVKCIPKLLLEERTVKETAGEYMKYTLLSAHRELKHHGQKYGVCATLCHISRDKTNNDCVSSAVQGRKFVLRIASVGEASAYLIRKNGYVKLTPGNSKRKIGSSASFPVIVPDPEISEVTLGDQDDYLIIANKKLWEIVEIEIAIKEIKCEENVILAAKRIQDIAQSFGAEENLSLILVKFNNLGTDVDFLIRELRQTVRKKSTGIMSNFCKCGCCCEPNNSCCHSPGSVQFIRQFSGRSDRSSPSGQSDQAGSELISNMPKSKFDTISTKTNKTNNPNRNIKNGIARAVRARIEEEHEMDDNDSALSEEQFKCWEYMLEQNTHILFDKELNTISKGLTKNRSYDKSSSIINLNNGSQSNLSKASSNKVLSASSPQLLYNDPKLITGSVPYQYNSNSFLSKHFGSARSFQPPPPTFFKSSKGLTSGRLPPIGAGANAAYFGSLQRLMPYNLEYDFAAMHERHSEEDLDHENRMRQYWGVATTEL